MIPLRRLRAVLHRAAEHDAPPVDAAFADQLEARLRVLAGGPVSQGTPMARTTGRRAWSAAGAIAIAAASIAAVVISTAGDDTNQVTTLPGVETSVVPTSEVPVTTVETTTTTSTSAPIASTTTAPPVTSPPPTTTTTARPATTTTSTTEPKEPKESTTTTLVTLVPTTSTTEKPATTTTTTKPGTVQNLAMSCQSTGTITAPAITCRWTQSNSETFNNYIVKRLMDNQTTTLLEDTNRSRVEYVDTSPRLGATIKYGVIAREKSGKTLGEGSSQLTCC